jgi:hypothetical protein
MCGRRGLVAVVVLAAAAGPAVGQVQGYPVDPEPGGRAAVLLRPVPAGRPADPPPAPPPARYCPPEPDPADPFRRVVPGGAAVTGFPQQLLWEPPLASLREPRFLFMPTTLSNPYTTRTLETAIGNTVGLLRVEPPDSGLRLQLDMFGLVASRISSYDYLVTTDYRAGLPLTFACGPWHGKIGYEHTSTHLGDETLERTGRRPFDYIKDELVVGVGRWLCDDSLRVYGMAGWAFFLDVPGTSDPFRFDLGFEWYKRRATGARGQPFAAGNVEFNGAVGYNPALSLQAGWQWRNPDRRLSQLRVFGQYYAGRSPYGMFFQDRESWFGVGVALDY